MDAGTTTAALQAQLHAVYDVLEDGVMLFDMSGKIVLVNEAEVRLYGYASREEMMHDLGGLAEVWEMRELDGTPVPVERWPFSRVLRGERVAQWELQARRRDIGRTWVISFSGQPVHNAENNAVLGVVISRDLTEQRRRERELRVAAERDRVRARLADALRSLTGAVAIQEAATRVLGEHLGASRVHYAEISADEQYAEVCTGYHAGVPSVVGCHRLDEYGSAAMAEMRTGKMLAIADVAHDRRLSEAEKAGLARLDVGAYVAVPLFKPDRAGALLVAQHRRAHVWSADELYLIEEVAERTWSAVERARSEQALRSSEERYRALFESIDQGFCVFEMIFDEAGKPVDYRFLETNPAFERHTGLQNAVGKRARELVPDLEDHWPEVYGRVALTGEPHHFEQGSAAMGRCFEVAAGRVGPAEERKVALAFTEVSERKRAEAALRESEERFRHLADAVPQLVWIAGSDGQVTYYNSRAAQYRGLERAEEGHWSWDPVVHPEDRAFSVKAWKSSVENGSIYECEHRLCMADGTYRWHLSRGYLVLEDDTPARWFGTATDIHEVKEAQEALRDADRRKDEYLAMLGHELRNPLAAIKSATELIRLVESDDPRLDRASGVLVRQSAHMAGLIDGLLEVSRIARGKVQLDRKAVDARAVCEGVLEDRGPQFDASELELKSELPAQPVWVWADPVRLSQVLDNLVGNALKFTPPSGSISLAMRREDGRAVIAVRDTGVGVRPEGLAQIFEPFHQEHQDVARASGGLGLGLALSKALVELHGGTIEARSAGLGAGAEFIVRLPLTAEPPATKGLADSATTEVRQILLVEDNRDAARMLLDLLELKGHGVIVAEDGRAALEVLRRGHVDLVLCDIGLPDMSGYDVARAVRAEAGLRDLPLIAITGYGQPEDRKRTAEAGFAAHLTKPVDLSALDAILARFGSPER